MSKIIKWEHDPTKEWRCEEFESIPSPQECNEMATSTQLIEKTQTGADMPIEVKENNHNFNNAIKAMFDLMSIEPYTIGIQLNDGSESISLDPKSKYKPTIGFGTGMDHINWGLEIQLDQFNPDYIYPVSTSSLFGDFNNNIGILNSSDEIKAIDPSCNLERRSGWYLVYKPITDSQEEEALVQQQVPEDEVLVLKKHCFGQYLTIGQKNKLKREWERTVNHSKSKFQLSIDSSDDTIVLFGKQECLVDDKNWRRMENIDYGELLQCIHCHKPTGVIFFIVESPKGERANKGGKVITNRIKTKFYCNCEGEDLFGTEDKAVSAEEIKKIMNTPPVPTQISELDDLTGCHWYNNILLIVGQPGWGKTRASVIIALKILQNNPNAIVLYISQDMSQADTYEFFTERWGNESWVKEFVEEKKDANSQPIPNSQRLVFKPLQTPTFDRLKEAIIQLGDDNLNKEIYVFVDHIGKFIGAVNDQEKSIDFMNLMKVCLSSNNHCHIALLHHLNKKNTGTIKNKDDDTTTQQNEEKLFKKMTGQDVMGTSYIYSSVDHAIVTFGIEDENVIKLKSLKGRFGKRSEITELDSHPLCPSETPC